MLETWLRDLRHAARSLSRAPGFTLVVVATLALAIGANAAIFSLVKVVLLEPLPFPNADRLVAIEGTAPGTDQPAEFGVSDELFFEYRESAPGLEDLGLYGTGSSTTRAEGHVDQLFLTQATPSFFTTLGARPLRGRLPNDQDDGRAVVLSYWLWQTWFGSSEAVLGKSYTFAGQTRQVIGIMPPEFRFPDERVAFWVALPLRAAQATPAGGFGTRVVARMAPGVDRAKLTAQLAPLAKRVQQRLGGPAPYARIMEHHRPIVKALREQLVGNVATALWILLGTVAIVFLIACANVANLFTVRAENRRRDLSVRRALGAGRSDLVRPQLAEALLLAVTGGAIGGFLAWVCVPLLVSAAPAAVAGGFSGAPIPGLASARLDLPALLYTAGLSILAACAFGVLPAFRVSGARLGSVQQAGRGIVGHGSFARDALVVVQTASALVLLVGSALLVRSFWRLSDVNAGYDTKNIFTFQIAPRPEKTDRLSISQFQYAFMDRLKALPGVESIGFITTLPLDEGAGSANVTTPAILASGAEAPLVRAASAGGAYFQTMGIELLSGRFFDRVEEELGTRNVIISKSAAATLFPGENPLQKQVRPVSAPADTWFEVIGVVEDVLVDDLRRKAPEPMVYLPGVATSPAYVMKSARAEQLEPEVRAVIREMIPESPMYRIFTMERLAANAMASLSFTMLMVSVAAALALILGAVGLYGVLSYRVTQRAQEIGVRMALGAEAKTVRRMFVWQGTRVALLGAGLGLALAAALTTYIQTLLFDVGRLDVTAFIGMSAVMLGVALLASYIPARRASRVDPLVALRAE